MKDFEITYVDEPVEGAPDTRCDAADALPMPDYRASISAIPIIPPESVDYEIVDTDGTKIDATSVAQVAKAPSAMETLQNAEKRAFALAHLLRLVRQSKRQQMLALHHDKVKKSARVKNRLQKASRKKNR